MFVNNLSPGNFGADGVYIQRVPATPVTPTGPAIGKLGIVGSAQWGAFNTPILASTAADLYAQLGNNTALKNAIVRDALAAMPEASQLACVRVGDGTEAAATIVVQDAVPATVFTLTAVNEGDLPSAGPIKAQCEVSLKSGTAGAGPVFRIAITFPNATTEIFDNIVGYAAPGGAYDAATFKANALAAINVGTATNAPSSRWTATTGISTAIPLLTPFTASGGANGDSGLASADLIGVDGDTGRTGLYALRGAVQGGQVIIAGFTDATQAEALIGFASTEACLAGISFPLGTDTPTAIASIATNGITAPLIPCIDWEKTLDPYSGLPVYVAPAAKVMGIIASLDYYQDPSNKPYGNGAQGVLGTERYATPITIGEATTRKAAGLQYLTNPIPRGAVWGLTHGKLVGGGNIADTRSADFIGLSLEVILGPFVGEDQTDDANDATRSDANAAVISFLAAQQAPVRKIDAFRNVVDTSNNTPTTVEQGFLNDSVAVRTLSGVEFVLVSEQVGTTVQITAQAA